MCGAKTGIRRRIVLRCILPLVVAFQTNRFGDGFRWGILLQQLKNSKMLTVRLYGTEKEQFRCALDFPRR